MGFLSGIFRGIKKAVKGVTKVVKKVVKGIVTVGKKIWNGVKGLTKKIGKLGPLAAIAIGFIPGFQALWANAGIWGAIGKGAITGFITSGGKLKGALMGAVGGGIGYGLNAGMNAYGKGVNNLLAQDPNATISQKITAGLKSVGASTTEGMSNMYKSAANLSSQGNLNYLRNDPITGELTSIYGDSKASVFARMDGESILHGANKNYISSLDTKAQNFIADNADSFKDLTPKQVNQIFENQRMPGVDTWGQTDSLRGYTDSVASERALAKAGGYTYDKYDANTYLTPSSAEYQSALDARGLDARGTIAKALDQPLKPNIMDVNYRGDLKYTEMGMDENSFSSSQRIGSKGKSKNTKNIADALNNALGEGNDSPIVLGVGEGDNQFKIKGGSDDLNANAAFASNFTDDYGRLLTSDQMSAQARSTLQSILSPQQTYSS